MDFEISDDQEELRRSVREVLSRECEPALARAVAEGAQTPPEPWKSARELGWTGIWIPEAYGGLGLRFEELGLVVEEHGRHLAPGPFLATLTQFLPVLLEAGTPTQQAHHLPVIAKGDRTGALAVAGANGAPLRGADPALRARRDERHEGAWILDGERHWVLDGDSADEIVAVAQVVGERDQADDPARVGIFLVPRISVKTERVESLDATRPLATLRFEDVQVEPDRVLGVPGRCADAVAAALDASCVALALETVGTCQTLLDITLEHARQRVQFGRPIGSFQSLQHKLADMFVAVEKARAIGYFAMMTVAERDPRRSLAASMAKASAGECQERLCKEAIQIHGGTGFTWESDVHLFVKRAQSGTALFGTASQHRAHIADALGV